MGGEGELDLVTTGGAEGKTGRYYSSGRMSPVLYVCVDIPLDQSARGEAKGKGQASMRGSNALRSELCQVSFCRSVAFFGGQRQVGQAGCSSRGNAGDVGAEWSLPTARQQRLDEGLHVELDATVQPNGSTSAALRRARGGVATVKTRMKQDDGARHPAFTAGAG